tara:strand:- start:18605 stop:18787 length:183 start_codon:yes stop_codon:yes gene_type:complete
MSTENIDIVNIAVFENKELTIYWGVHIPHNEFIKKYLDSKGHETSTFYLINSIKEVHYNE